MLAVREMQARLTRLTEEEQWGRRSPSVCAGSKSSCIYAVCGKVGLHRSCSGRGKRRLQTYENTGSCMYACALNKKDAGRRKPSQSALFCRPKIRRTSHLFYQFSRTGKACPSRQSRYLANHHKRAPHKHKIQDTDNPTSRLTIMVHLRMLVALSLIISIIRPGVATTISGPSLRAFCISHFPAPPYTAHTLQPYLCARV